MRLLLLLYIFCIAGIVQGQTLLYGPSVTRASAANDVVAFILQNPTTSSLSSRYITFGHPFFVSQLKFSNNQSTVQLSAYNTASPTTKYSVQVDAKAFHADGSVRQATLTLLAPALNVNQSIEIMLTRTSETATPLSLSSVPTTLTLAFSSVSGTSRTYSFDASALIKANPQNLWLNGNLAVQGRIEKWVINAMRVVLDVTLYKDNSWCVDAIISNDIAMSSVGGSLSYTATITSTPFTQAFAIGTHYQYQGWHKLVCSNGDSNYNVQYDRLHLIQSRVVLPLNYTIGIYDTTLNGQNNEMKATGWGTPLADNGVTKGMPMTGDRRDIGWLPGPHSNWFVSQDWNAKKFMMGWGDASHAVPWNYYLNTTGRYINYWDYPNLWIDGRGDPKPPQLNDDQGGWDPENAHNPSLPALPYVVSGSRYYLDLVKALAAWQICVVWNAGRSNFISIDYVPQDRGLLSPYNQERGLAWSLRDVGWAAYLSEPTDTFHSNYFPTVMKVNLDFLAKNLTATTGALQGVTYGYFFGVYSTGYHPPWQDDYLVSTISMLHLQGNADALAVLTWMRNFCVMSFFASGWNTWNRMAYNIGHQPRDDDQNQNVCKTYACIQTNTEAIGYNVTNLQQLGGDYGQLARQSFMLYQAVNHNDVDAKNAQLKVDSNNVQFCDIETYRNDPRFNSAVFPDPPTVSGTTTSSSNNGGSTTSDSPDSSSGYVVAPCYFVALILGSSLVL